MAQITLKKTKLYLHYGDGAGGLLNVEVRVGEGNISWSEKRTIEYTLDRGNLRYVSETEGGAAREGDDQPVDASFDILWDWYSGAADPVMVLKGLDPDGTDETSESTTIASAHAADPCAPHAVTIEIVYEPDCAEGSEEIVHYVLPYFRWESLNYDISAGQISCSGTCQSKSIYIAKGGGSTPIAADIITANE